MRVVLESSELANWELVQRKLRRSEFAEAEAFVRSEIARCGLLPTYAALLARVLKRVGRYNEALSVLDECCKLHPDSMRIYAEKGDTHFSRAHYIPAAENYAAALAADAEDCMNPMTRELIQDNLAMSRYFLGDAAGAAEQLSSLVVRHPEEARFRMHCAQALATSAGDDIAIADLPDIDDEYARDLAARLCRSLLDEKRFYNALRCSEQLTGKYPDNPQAICCHADVLYRLMRFDAAADLLEDALRRHVDASLYSTLAKCYQTSNRIQLARGACLAGLFHFPDAVNSLLVPLFEIDWSLGKEEECIKYCERMMAFPNVYNRVLQLEGYKAITRKLHGTSEVSQIEERQPLRRCFDIIKGEPLAWNNEHDPSKESLPEAASNDLPETAPLNLVFRNNALAYMDVQSIRCNVKDGHRVTVNQPEEYDYTVFLAGKCIVSNGWCDSVTLSSALQDVFNAHPGRKVRVVNCGTQCASASFANMYLSLTFSNELRPGDKVLLYTVSPTHKAALTEPKHLDTMTANYVTLRNDLTLKGVELYLGFTCTLATDPRLTFEDDKLFGAFDELNLIPSRQHAADTNTSLANRLNDFDFTFAFFDHVFHHKSVDPEKKFWKDHVHYSLSINWPLAEAMYDFLSRPATMTVAENQENVKKKSLHFLANQAFDVFSKNEDIQSWIKETYDAAISNRRNVGAIVMNCNPFTLGHRYLVEQALDAVETLYLFVVEEDLSMFSFADRLAMVEKGVGDLRDRVKVAAGGKFIISSFSFPEYFTKAVENAPADSTTDLLIFAAVIAPALNIRTRFVGEEPTCLVTRSYNERMQQLLPDMGCAIRIIPRKEADGMAISASRVRKALEENDLHAIRNLVPDTTYDYLKRI